MRARARKLTHIRTHIAIMLILYEDVLQRYHLLGPWSSMGRI